MRVVNIKSYLWRKWIFSIWRYQGNGWCDTCSIQEGRQETGYGSMIDVNGDNKTTTITTIMMNFIVCVDWNNSEICQRGTVEMASKRYRNLSSKWGTHNIKSELFYEQNVNLKLQLGGWEECWRSKRSVWYEWWFWWISGPPTINIMPPNIFFINNFNICLLLSLLFLLKYFAYRKEDISITILLFWFCKNTYFVTAWFTTAW